MYTIVMEKMVCFFKMNNYGRLTIDQFVHIKDKLKQTEMEIYLRLI